MAKSAQAQYQKWVSTRQQFLRRAHECAKLTIPTLVPRETDQVQRSTEVTVNQPWQSLGSQGVNTLASKLLLTLLPPNSPFFMLSMGRKERQELLQLEGPEADEFKAEIEAGLQSIEQEVVRGIERSPTRTVLFSVIKHLLVAGNVLMYVGKQPRAFPLSKYVVRRDPAGNILKMIVKEVVDRSTLPRQTLEAARAAGKLKDTGKDDDEDVTIYTVIDRVNDKSWTSWQEVFDIEVAGTRGRYTDETLPWLALRMIVVDGEDYGRSYVEELFGDLQSCESLTQSIVEGGLMSSRFLWMVNPNGLTDPDDIDDAENGDSIRGREEDVKALQANKMGDLSVAERTLTVVADRLTRSFLMTASIQRDAERVTAFEMQILAQELEDTFGGYYSLLSQELQLRMVRRWIRVMEDAGELPKLPTGSVEPMIVTGLDALGRGQDLSRLRGFIADIQGAAQALPSISSLIDEGELIQRLANGHGVDVAGLVKSDQQLAQEAQQQQQAAMQQEMVSKGVGPAINAAAQASKEAA